MINRVILIVLGYPQIGSRSPDGIHISHSIYGGFSMMIATVVALAFLSPSTRWFLAVVGGLGFGWYVDELGKYVSNAGYLFEPALALIYVVFVVMYLVFRSLAGRAFQPDDAVVNALESLQAATLGALDERSRRQALARFDALAPHTDYAAQVRALLADAPATPPRPPGPTRRVRSAVRARYVAWSHRRSFTVVIEVFFGLLAVGTFAEVVGLSLDGPGITQPAERVASLAAGVAAILVVIGMSQLRRSRLSGYRWFDRAMLIRILVVQIYLFRTEQFAATAGLAVDLLVWTMLRSAMAIEERRATLGDDVPEGAAAGAVP